MIPNEWKDNRVIQKYAYMMRFEYALKCVKYLIHLGNLAMLKVLCISIKTAWYRKSFQTLGR